MYIHLSFLDFKNDTQILELKDSFQETPDKSLEIVKKWNSHLCKTAKTQFAVAMRMLKIIFEIVNHYAQKD